MSALIWFRRDLRLDDHAVIYHALRHHEQVWAVFVFDTSILSQLPKDDARISFIFGAVDNLRQELSGIGGLLLTFHGDPVTLIPQIAQSLGVDRVYASEDYEPSAIARDHAVAKVLQTQGQSLVLLKDQVIFAKDEVLSQKKTPLTVFTPYKNAWLKRLTADDFAQYDYSLFNHHWAKHLPLSDYRPIHFDDLGFEPQPLKQHPSSEQAQQRLADFLTRISRYKEARDFPSIKGVSHLSVYLRFGFISIRQLVAEAFMRGGDGAITWSSELIWREFYMQFLWHHPFVVDMAYLPQWRDQPWTNDPEMFTAWCEGRTGYPIVDAAMRQLNQTGFMHNRLRMITAAFLIKDLDINWQWGEAYFAKKLLDFDLSANNGGWQWAASTGCDAAQPFRIFNPVLQSQKFDPDGKFICRYVPEVSALSADQIHAPWQLSAMKRSQLGLVLGKHYPFPMVDHDQARKQALIKYDLIKTKNN